MLHPRGKAPHSRSDTGFLDSRPAPTAGFLVSLSLSMYLPAYSLRRLPVGTAYAVWTGIGAAGTALISMLWLGEAGDVLRRRSHLR